LTDAKGNVGTATYTMGAPAITLSPASAAVGSTVTVSGSGFASGATVSIAYGATPVVLTTVTATSQGTFTKDITVPANQVKGPLSIVAYETAATATNRATATLTVIPKVTIEMGNGAASGTNMVPKNDAGTTITVSATGFAPSSAVTFSWFPSTPSNTFTPATLVTTSAGILAATTSTAAAIATAGTYTLTVTDASGNSATAQMIVGNSGTMWTISPASGPVGTAVTATYFGGANTAAGVVTIGGATASASTVASAAAYPTSATKVITIPTLSAGTYLVTGTGDWAAFGALGATFTVTSSTPSATLAQATAAKGQVIGASGSGFIPSSTLTFSILGNPIGTVAASATGTFATTLTVPNVAVGTYNVLVTDTSYNTAIVSLTIAAPTVTLSATTIQLTGLLGATRVLFNGTGFFGSGSAFTITLGGSACVVQTSLMDRPDGFGVAYGSFTVPSGLVAGAQTLVITDASGNSYTTTMTVRPSITISPSAAPAGNVVTLSGTAFAANSQLSLALDGTLLQLYTGTTAGATTTGAGAVPGSVTFTIPATTAGGAHTITVSDYATVNNTQTATLTVTSPTLTLTPNTGAAGITVTVTGTGWLPGVTAGTITFGTTVVSSTLATGSAGAATGVINGGNTFTVPQVAAGDYTVTVSDGVESLTATFTVTTAAIALSASTGNVGDVIYITGTGFNPQTINLGVTTVLTFGSTAITTLATGFSTPVVYANGTLGCTNTVTNTAVMGIPVVVPSSVAGANTVTIAFSAPALTSSTTYTVVPKITASPTAGILKGTTMTITATGFAATSALTATLNGVAVTLTSGTATIAAGTASPTFFIPVTVAAGANTLVITDAAGNSATTTITVGTPSIASLSVASGPAGTAVQVTGTGFFVTTGNQIFISFDGVTLATNPTTVATSTGSFIAFVNIPAGATVGTHTITATDSNNNQATATFTVTSGSTGITVNQSTMQSSAQTTNGAGQATTTFTAGSTVKASFSLVSSNGASGTVFCAVTFQQGAKVYNMASTPAAISPTANIVSFSNLIPAGATGTWTATLQVYASDGTTPLGVSTLTFTVS